MRFFRSTNFGIPYNSSFASLMSDETASLEEFKIH